ncbi:MAG TPA: LacI family DNA-binding transcriptional regulator [Salinivirga sp.]|uniref:LacI family DNA-binding transcriptional regulator n=1 Tax=Salinivirga sp. TaxID=1970192 RepID=UPI002B490CF1|nr:LacI family DNA-binding transcriptional regulator [Salinivirga sp.]HKK60637.1 LacI family DNA-binding transcriptional regulator [Salinivirga sp.]
MKRTFITIKDIARALSISASTVSRALKDHPDISQETKDRVVAYAREMGYQPNSIALSLKSRQSHVIGLIVPEIVHHFFSSVISGIDEVASKAGYNVIISQSNESFEREIHNTRTLLGSRVDGMLISRTKETVEYDHFRHIDAAGVPMVFFDRTCEGVNADNVIIDDKKAAFDATEYLINTGCKKIVHLKGPENLTISHQRLTGYRQALEKYAIPYKNEYVIEADNYEKGENAIRQLLSEHKLPDAIFTVNDLTALGAISALKEGGIKIPDQVSVVGFTNGVISRLSDPPLTTIEQNGFLMGEKAAKLLLERINNEEELPSRTEVIPTKLIVRKSTY